MVPDVCRILSVSRVRLHELTARGDLACVRFGRSVRYRPADVERFIAERLSAPARPAAADDLANVVLHLPDVA